MDETQSTDLKDSPPETPTIPTSDSISREESTDRPKKARRTFLTQNACTRCRQKKSKCDGKRPICGRCEKHGAECAYDVAQEGITRMQNLQQQLEGKTGEHGKLMNLFLALQQGSDHEATSLLARLRLGANVDDLLSMVEAAQASSSANQNDSSRSQLQPPPPGYMRSWPPSPLDEGSWTSWSTRCDPGGQTSSQSSDSRLDGTRLGVRIPPLNPAFNIRDGYYQNEPRDGYYRQMQQERFPDQQRTFPQSSLQWQHPQASDDDVSPATSNPDVQYYGEPQQFSSNQMDHDHHQYVQRDGMGHSSSRQSGS